ncbi:MAG: hypothetical protein WDO71_28195 [Bacteroidota bacterium]
MRAKKILQIASLVMFIAIALPAGAATTDPASSPANSPVKTENPRTVELLQRLEDIRDMNKSELSRSEKKSLRKEVKAIKKEMKAGNSGVYISVGAIIIIILLLILIL